MPQCAELTGQTLTDAHALRRPAWRWTHQDGGSFVWDTVLAAPPQTWGSAPHLLFLQAPRGTHAHDTSVVVATSAVHVTMRYFFFNCSPNTSDRCLK